VQGIALMTLLRTQGQALLPLVYRRQSVPKGIVPGDLRVYDWVAAYVRMDSWYASLQNLKQIAALTRLKHNRLVNPDGRGDRPIEAVAVPPEGRAVHLKGLGFVGRGRGMLGDRWPADGGREAGRTGKAGLGDPGAQAVLWGRAGPGAQGGGHMGASAPGFAGLPAPGGLPITDGGELV